MSNHNQLGSGDAYSERVRTRSLKKGAREPAAATHASRIQRLRLIAGLLALCGVLAAMWPTSGVKDVERAPAGKESHVAESNVAPWSGVLEPPHRREEVSTHQATGTESEPAARDSDDTVLRVRIAAPNDLVLSSGVLLCTSADRPRVELATDALVQSFALSEAPTEIVVPGTHVEAMLTVIVDGATPVLHRVRELRGAGSRWQEHGRLVRDVTVELGTEQKRPSIVGVVRMDDGGALPPTLAVKFQPVMVRRGGASNSVAMAALDPRTGRFAIEFGSASSGYLIVTSAETATRTLKHEVEDGTWDDSPEPVEIELPRGIEIGLVLFDRSNKRVADHPLVVDFSIEGERSTARVSHSARRIEIRTDQDGSARLEHVSGPGWIRILDGRAEVLGSPLVEARIEDVVTRHSARDNPLTVQLGEPPSVSARLWGSVPPSGDESADRSVLIERVGAETGAAVWTIDVDDAGTWVSGALTAGDYRVVALERGSAISAVLAVELGDGEQLGPIALESLPGCEIAWETESDVLQLDFEWANEGEWRLIRRVERPSARGVVRLRLPERATHVVRCCALLSDRAEIVRLFPVVRSEARLHAELLRGQALDLRVRCDGIDLPKGAAVEFRELDPRDAGSERVAISRSADASGARALDLPPGRYVYVVRGLGQAALIGLVDVSPDPTLSTVDVDWRSTIGPGLELAPTIEITHVQGVELGRVPREFRSFVSSLASVPPTGDSPWRCPLGSRWIAGDR